MQIREESEEVHALFKKKIKEQSHARIQGFSVQPMWATSTASAFVSLRGQRIQIISLGFNMLELHAG